MAKLKYEKLITTNREHRHADWVSKVPRDPEGGKIVTWLDGDVIPGAFCYEAFMALKPTLEGSFNDPPHVHEDWDEVIGIYGTNPADLFNLGGEADILGRTIIGRLHNLGEDKAYLLSAQIWC